MGKIIEYEHYGVKVKVDEDLKGKHRQMCLCWRCSDFKPGQVSNCYIAQKLYNICVEYNLVTPVFECMIFSEGEPDLSGMKQ